METLYIFSLLEFQILVSAAGLTHVFGIKPKINMDEKNVPYAIHEMVQRDILKVEADEKFRVNEPYKKIFMLMNDAKTVISFFRKRPSPEMQLAVYCGEKEFVLLEQSIHDFDESVRIGLYDNSEFRHITEDLGLWSKEGDLEGNGIVYSITKPEMTNEEFDICDSQGMSRLIDYFE